MRLDQYLAQQYPEQSRSTWKKLVLQGNVTVNGHVATEVKQEIRETDKVDVTLPEVVNHSAKTLPIIYEDDNVIVINKPVGVLSHSKGALNDEFTVAEFFRSHSTYHEESNRPGIIHRLDRATSGIMIGAKNQEAADLLNKQFQDRKAKKVYYAVIEGHLKEDNAMIDLPIERNPKAPSTFRVGPNGKPAQTFYEVIETNDTMSLIKLMPRTGRTHQLRVHMQYLNTPIKGDHVYGKPDDRLYLHAFSLEITIPGGKRMTFETPVPPEFEEQLR